MSNALAKATRANGKNELAAAAKKRIAAICSRSLPLAALDPAICAACDLLASRRTVQAIAREEREGRRRPFVLYSRRRKRLAHTIARVARGEVLELDLEGAHASNSPARGSHSRKAIDF